jgi:hypothetical protein
MSGKVEHIALPTVSLFTTGKTTVTTRNESFQGPTAVAEKLKSTGKVAFWGPGNNDPQRLVDDKRRIALVGAVIEKKSSLLISGGLRYGKVQIDEMTGVERMIPRRDPVIEQWLKNSNIKLFLREAANDWYTYANVFTEFTMGRGYDRVTGIGVVDASHTRLGTMNDKSEITKAYLADWRSGAAESEMIERPALDPYRNVADQLLKNRDARSILPIRVLNDGNFYYGSAPWHALQHNGWFDVAKRVPILKKALLENLMHVRYHLEIDERYWSHKFKDWTKKTEAEQIELMKAETIILEDWLKGAGQGGAFMSTMKGMPSGGDQLSLVKINEKKITIAEGAYIEDSQEADFIITRDMGLKPSLIGISPSKSGSSPGSGSEDRVSRTNHVLDCKADQDMILEPLNHVRDVNGWDPEIEFWFSNYHAATLDRTNQVDAKPNAGPER